MSAQSFLSPDAQWTGAQQPMRLESALPQSQFGGNAVAQPPPPQQRTPTPLDIIAFEMQKSGEYVFDKRTFSRTQLREFRVSVEAAAGKEGYLLVMTNAAGIARQWTCPKLDDAFQVLNDFINPYRFQCIGGELVSYDKWVMQHMRHLTEVQLLPNLARIPNPPPQLLSIYEEWPKEGESR